MKFSWFVSDKMTDGKVQTLDIRKKNRTHESINSDETTKISSNTSDTFYLTSADEKI